MEGWFITKKPSHPRILKILKKTLTFAVLMIGAFAMIVPFYWMFISSLKTYQEIISIGYIAWWPSNPQWENFIKIWTFLQTPTLARAFLNSAITTVASVLLMLFFSSMTAYALAKYDFRERDAIFKIMVSMLFIPGFIFLIPNLMIMRVLGWFDTYWALIIPGFVSAYSVFFLRQYMITIPDELIDAARVYGCSELGIFWRIILPLSRPVLAALGIISAVTSWNNYMWPLLVIYNPDLKTIQLVLAGMWDFRGTLEFVPLVAAALTISTLPLIVLTVITQKYLIQGWTGLTYARR